jgi:hypothetical protein
VQLEEEILSEISPFIQPQLDKCHDHRIDYSYGLIQINCQPSEDVKSKTLLLKLFIDHDNKQVQLPNIFLPEFMRKSGLGKRLISIVYSVAEKHGYELFITEMTESFFARMIARGAVPCEEDIVMITAKTDLMSIQAGTASAGA